MRILVVDDDQDVAASLCMYLQQAGHTVETAADGDEALERSGRLRPHAVLTDIGLPDMDGCQLAQRLRAEADPRLLLVAISGYCQEEDKQRAREAGFDHYFVKPLLDLGLLDAALASATATAAR